LSNGNLFVAQRAAWHVEWHLETNSLAWHSETNSLSLSLCILSLSLQTDESMMISSRLRSDDHLFVLIVEQQLVRGAQHGRWSGI
jgi:alkylated DNA repair dioxygenase AlkB